MPLVDLGPVKKKRTGLVDLGPAPTPIMAAIKATEPVSVEPTAEDLDIYRRQGVKQYRSPIGELFDPTPSRPAFPGGTPRDVRAEPASLELAEAAKQIVPQFVGGVEEMVGAAGSMAQWSAEQQTLGKTLTKGIDIPGIDVITEYLIRKFGPKKPVAFYDKQMKKYAESGKKWADWWEEQANKGWEAPDPGVIQAKWSERPIVKGAAVISRAAPNYLAAIAASVLTKNPQVGLMFISALSGAGAYRRQRKAGVGKRMANAVAMGTAAWEYVTEKVPFDEVFKPSKHLLLKMLKVGTLESAQEFVQGIGENFLEYFGYTAKDLKSVPAAVKEGLKHAMDGWVENVVAGFGLGVIGAGAVGRRGIAPTQPPPAEAPIPAAEPAPTVRPTPEGKVVPQAPEFVRPEGRPKVEKVGKPLITPKVTAEKGKYTPAPKAAEPIIPGTDIQFDKVETTFDGKNNWVVFGKNNKRVHTIKVRNAPQAEQMAKDYRSLLVAKPAPKAEGKYIYHGTSEGAFRKIRREGMKGKVNYFADTEQYAQSYADRKGTGERLIRIRRTVDIIPDEKTTGGDYKTTRTIKPSEIEVKVGDKWISIQEYTDEARNIMPISKPETKDEYRARIRAAKLVDLGPAKEKPEVEIRDLSEKTRKKQIKQTEEAIKKHDIYETELAAAEAMRREVDVGFYYIGPKFRGEVEGVTGKPGEKGYKAALYKSFTFEKVKGAVPWDTAATERGLDITDISEFVRLVERAIETKKIVGALNQQALERAIASGDPYFELLAMKREMLKDGLTAAEINNNLKEQAKEYNADVTDLLVPIERVEHVEKKPGVVKEVARKGRQAKAKLSPEQAAILKAKQATRKLKRPVYVYKKQGRFTVSKNLPTSGIYTKVAPPRAGEIKSKISQEKIEPRKRIKVEVRKPDEPLAVSRVEKPVGRIKTVHYGPEWYEANARKYRKSILSRLSIGKKAFSELGRAIWSSSGRLYRIAPELFRATRKYVYDVTTRAGEMTADTEPFIKAIRKMNKADWRKLDLALKNSDKEAIQGLVARYHLETEYDAVRDVLNELYEAGNEVGLDIEYHKDYWPRVLSDTEGFLQHFYQRDDWSIIEEAIKRRAKRAGRTIEELTDDEKAQVINTLLRGYKTQALTLARPGAAKERTVETIDRELNRFYDDSRTAILKYIRIMNTKIAAREFFGRETREITKLRGVQSARRTRLLKLTKRVGLRHGATETKYKEHISKAREAFEADQERLNRLTKRAPKDTIGGYTYDLVRAGKIKPGQERQIQQILQGIFDPHGMSNWMGYVSTGIYLDTLNSPLQALTQLDEFAYSFYRAPLKSIPVAIRTAFRRSKIKPADIGVKSIGYEFQGPSMRKGLTLLLKSTGFEMVDRLNKENYINTVLSKYQSQARKKSPSLANRLARVFGKDYKNVLEELRKPVKSLDDISDNVKYLLFNEILDIQPIAISEMPEAYNKAGNMRILYALKTFYIKRVDFIRNECFSDMKHAKTFVRGLSKLIWLAFSFALMGAGSDFLKDFIKGRAFNLKDSIVDNILRMGFFSKYQAWRTREKGLGTAVIEGWRPPTKAIDAATRDIIAKAQGKERGLEIWRSVPIVGELYYWWFGRGREKIEKKQGKQTLKRKKRLEREKRMLRK